MEIADIINIVLLFVTTIGVFAAFRQISISNKQKRADLILQLYQEFSDDHEMQNIYYQIEYGQFNYEPNEFHMSENEKKLDKLLGLFSNIGQLYQLGIVKIKDLDFIKYEFQVIYETQGVQDYFQTLDTWFERRQISHKKFQPFRDVGKLITQNNYNGK
tara:strand:- start:706 stop:1182 length:477 start_codon:yes stop_codon:yes gene_type:complete